METIRHPQVEGKQTTKHATEAHERASVNPIPGLQAETEKESAPKGLELLFERARKGDRSVLPELCAVLDADPRLWEQYGDIALHAEAALVTLVAGENLLMAESLIRKLQAMKRELGGPSPSPLERLQVERVTATWLHVNYYESQMAQTKKATDRRWKHLERLQDAANRRHQAAIKSLATIRKLLTPAPSPFDIACRMDVPDSIARRGREGFAGKVRAPN
jgi:hypothetical protein